jgi:hypothetical protein
MNYLKIIFQYLTGVTENIQQRAIIPDNRQALGVTPPAYVSQAVNI